MDKEETLTRSRVLVVLINDVAARGYVLLDVAQQVLNSASDALAVLGLHFWVLDEVELLKSALAIGKHGISILSAY